MAKAIQAGPLLGGEVPGTLVVIGSPGRTPPAIDGETCEGQEGCLARRG